MRILTGMAIGLESLANLSFNPRTSYSCCRICGKVYQSDLDRKQLVEPHNLKLRVEAYELRRIWALKHADTHPEYQHHQLRRSGLFCTPEAANKLAAFGIIDLEQLADLQSEGNAAYAESSPIPTDDAEGG